MRGDRVEQPLEFGLVADGAGDRRGCVVGVELVGLERGDVARAELTFHGDLVAARLHSYAGPADGWSISVVTGHLP